MFKRRFKPNEVFTPRRAEVNQDMYISRPALEKKFRRAVDGTQHIVVFGDSGSGKTWLYRKYFEDQSINFKVVDLSVAVTKGLDAAMLQSLPASNWTEVEKSETTKLKVNAVVASPSEERTTNYARVVADPFTELLTLLASNNSSSNFIVFDNFEQISRNAKIVKEIASLILRLDNPEFAKFGVRFLFVGVVADMKELIARFDQMGTVNNRLTEIPEVSPLSSPEADALMDKGFVEKLRLKIEDKDSLYERIKFVTCRNAQQLHEICYRVACEATDSDEVVRVSTVEAAEKEWVESSLNQHVAQIESRMNKRDTKIQRRNQVLYCIGASGDDIYRASSIETMVRKIFPTTASVRSLGIDQILSGLADGSNPILIKNPHDSGYRLSHPKLRLAMRVRMEYLSSKTAGKSAKDPKITLKQLLSALESLRVGEAKLDDNS